MHFTTKICIVKSFSFAVAFLFFLHFHKQNIQMFLYSLFCHNDLGEKLIVFVYADFILHVYAHKH